MVVSQRQLERVSGATPAPQRTLRASSAEDARRVLREEPVDVLVVDPIVGNAASSVARCTTELFSIGLEFPYLPVVFSVSNPPKALPLIARFPARERCEAVVQGVDDDAETIGQALESVVASSLVARLLRQLGLGVTNTPSSLLSAVRQVLVNPRLFSSVHDVARIACMSRRTFDRWLARRGLVSGADLLQIAKAFVLVRLERDMHSVLGDAHAACGLPTTVRLSSFVARVTGISQERYIALGDREMIEGFAACLRREGPRTAVAMEDTPTSRHVAALGAQA